MSDRDVAALISRVEWGVEPPEAVHNTSPTDELTPAEIRLLAATRPGEWGRYETHKKAHQRANVLKNLGLESVARSGWVYFRTNPNGTA